MADTNNGDKLSNMQNIVKFAIDKKPSQMKSYVNKEIATRVMDRIEAKRSSVGSSLFGN